jgi:spore maturation protein CgeB
VIVGSFVPEGVAVGRLVQRLARGVTAFYDIDTPVTLGKLARGEHEYVSPALVRGYHLYLSFSGGPTLDLLEDRYGSPMARVLHCAVDADAYRPQSAPRRWDLSYLGTWSADRQPVLERLLIEPACRAPQRRFVVAGAQYPEGIAWPRNVERIEHVPPDAHPAFYAASRFTLNVTRADMVRAGWSPSVRLFEAASCATPVISDIWPGIDALFAPGQEILLAERSEDVVTALDDTDDARRNRMALAARARVLAAHTADHRAAELEAHLGDADAHRLSRAVSSRVEEKISL